MRVTSNLTATIDLQKFGPRQLSALQRYLKTGVLTQSTSVPARIARSIREAQHLPTIQAARNRNVYIWGGSDIEEIINLATAGMVAERLKGRDSWNDWQERCFAAWKEGKRDYCYLERDTIDIKKIKLQPAEMPDERYFELVLHDKDHDIHSNI